MTAICEFCGSIFKRKRSGFGARKRFCNDGCSRRARRLRSAIGTEPEKPVPTYREFMRRAFKETDK